MLINKFEKRMKIKHCQIICIIIEQNKMINGKYIFLGSIFIGSICGIIYEKTQKPELAEFDYDQNFDVGKYVFYKIF